MAGAFTSGGQGDLVLTEVHTQLTESLVWIKGHHQVQAGFQLPDWSRRGFFDRTNFNGTYYFSGLDTYAAGRPYSFIQQQGNGDVTFLEKQVGTYLKDDWQVASGILGLVRGPLRLAELFSRHQQLRAARLDCVRAGQQEDRTSSASVSASSTIAAAPRAIADLLQFQPGGLIRYVISNPSYPDPVQSGRRQPTQHRAACARRADSADGAIQRRHRSPVAQGADAVGDLHRRARLSPLPLARYQRAAAAALSDASQSGVQRRARDRVRRPAVDQIAAGDDARQDWAAGSTARRSTRGAAPTTTRTASTAIRPTITTSRASGPAPISIVRIAFCCSAV